MPQKLRLKPASAASIPVHAVAAAGWQDFLRRHPDAAPFAAASGFSAGPGAHWPAPDAQGRLAALVLGAPDASDPFLAGRLSALAPAGRYRLGEGFADPALAALGFLLGAYRFDRYRATKAPEVALEAPLGVDVAAIERIAAAVAFGRDLINTPANDMGPTALAAAARGLAEKHKARLRVTTGASLEKNFPLVHAVGKGAAQAPRLVDMRWGTRGPAIALVGKGVCFDTGGLDIKPESAMALMKKDMGGAAAALAAADMIMGARLPVRLRVIVPIVENSISGEAFRPGDVYRSRKGLTVEIGNTDAEGRLILADALALADEESPDLLVDFATLTGAARVALGPDLPPFFTDDEDLAAEIARIGAEIADPVWRLPLWSPYAAGLKGKIADLNNIAGSPFAGAIVAALFLKRFVTRTKAWAHFDIYGWNPASRPGRPEGGEVQAARLVYALVEQRARKAAHMGARKARKDGR
ncbi:MAG: leucyl aminopeptidase family protein [Hyphomicrobiales bacterium]|nr:leucyl aminopeptidase family protein [Hyphomicrobiales bacterium]